MSDSIPKVLLTDADFAKFHESAPRVLGGRDIHYFLREIDTGINLVVAGLLPVAGVAWWGWSATNWLVLLLVGCWVGIICDALRMFYLSKQLDLYLDRVAEDTFVSVVGEAIKKGSNEVVRDHMPTRPPYRLGMLSDLVFCSVSSIVILASLPESLFSGEVFSRSWFLPSLTCLVAYRVFSTLAEILHARHNDSTKPVVKLAFGLRGAAIFVTMFAVVIVLDVGANSERAVRLVVYIVNGLLIGLGLLCLLGVGFIFNETRWLRRYLSER